MRHLLAALILALSSPAFANPGPALPFSADWVAGFGLGKNVLKNSLSGSHETFEKGFWGGLNVTLLEMVFVEPQIGGYIARGHGRRSSLWFGATAGVKLATKTGWIVYLGVGPAYLTAPDNVVLSGHLQWLPTLKVCLESWLNVCAVGKHISSCSDCPVIDGASPNIGIDFLGLELNL